MCGIFVGCCASAGETVDRRTIINSNVMSVLFMRFASHGLTQDSWLAVHAYRITLSARASTFGGIVSPIFFAALRLIMNSNFVGCCTGKSAGLAPFKILSTYVAALR